jgi:hypothetical protein
LWVIHGTLLVFIRPAWAERGFRCGEHRWATDEGR